MSNNIRSQYICLLEDEFEKTIKHLYEGTLVPSEAKFVMLNLLKSYFDEVCSEESLHAKFDIEPLLQVSIGEKEYKTYKRNYNIGCFVTALWLLGSPKSQACLGTGKFLGHRNESPETSRKAIVLYVAKNPHQNRKKTDVDQFIYLNVYRLKEILDMGKSPFPDEGGVKDAKKAYDLLVKKVRKILDEDEAIPVEIVG